MNDKLEKVKMGYSHLSLDERKLFAKFMLTIDATTYTEDKKMIEQLEIETKFDLGPYNSANPNKCPCCGK